MQFAELLAVEKHKQTVDFTTDSGRDHNQSYFFVPKFSVLDQGPGRPFLLTKYCGRIFSARSGPVFGRGLKAPQSFHQKERPGGASTPDIRADGNFEKRLKEIFEERRQRSGTPMPRKEALKRKRNEADRTVPKLNGRKMFCEEERKLLFNERNERKL